MGKTSKNTTTATPSNSSSVISVNGTPLVTTKTDGGSISSNYNFSDAEKATNDYVQNALLSGIASINTFLPETINNINSQIDAYTQSGIDTINDTYTPMIKSLEEDVASRFGNLDNSIFLDSLGGLESKRSDAMSDLAQGILSKKSELIDDELNRQYSYLNFLTDYKDQTFSNMITALELGKSSLSLNNDYQSDVYNYSNASNSSNKITSSQLNNLYSYLSGLGSSLL